MVLTPLDVLLAARDMEFCALFEQTPWDKETALIAREAGGSWRMRFMTPDRPAPEKGK